MHTTLLVICVYAFFNTTGYYYSNEVHIHYFSFQTFIVLKTLTNIFSQVCTYYCQCYSVHMIILNFGNIFKELVRKIYYHTQNIKTFNLTIRILINLKQAYLQYFYKSKACINFRVMNLSFFLFFFSLLILLRFFSILHITIMQALNWSMFVMKIFPD